MEKYFFIIGNFRDFFSARQHIAYMHRALYAIARPSFRPSVRHRGGSEKTVGSWNVYLTVAPPRCGVSFIQKF